MKKKVICLFTNWYPTLENPFQGVFFREQVLALKEYFDFIVVHYSFRDGMFRGRYTVNLCNEESNIREYYIDLVIPTFIGNIKNKFIANSFNMNEEIKKKLISTFKAGIKDDFDVLYCVSGQSESVYLKVLAEAFQKPYVVSEHGPVPWLGTIVSEENRKGIETANLLLAISYDKLRQLMMQNIKLPPFIYVGNMVDEDIFIYRKSNNEIKTFVTVGAHVFYKNYDMYIKIMNRLKKLTKVPFKVIIVGYSANKGYSKDAELLESTIKESDFADCVEMIPFVSHNKMCEIYNRADAFIMTSVQEGMPVSALEAGCCGLPIFSTRCGGVEDYVTEQVGRIYGTWDVEGFAHGLQDFLEERITFDSISIRNTIIEKFGKVSFVNNMVSAFNSIIKD